MFPDDHSSSCPWLQDQRISQTVHLAWSSSSLKTILIPSAWLLPWRMTRSVSRGGGADQRPPCRSITKLLPLLLQPGGRSLSSASSHLDQTCVTYLQVSFGDGVLLHPELQVLHLPARARKDLHVKHGAVIPTYEYCNHGNSLLFLQFDNDLFSLTN